MKNKFKREITKDIIAIGWGGGAVLLSLTLASFSPLDPSLNSTGRGGAVHNLCGYFGSYVSDLLYQGFGMTAWAFVVLCAIQSWRTLNDEEDAHPSRSFAAIVMMAVIVSSLFQIHFPAVKFFTQMVSLGGFLGIVCSHALMALFSKIGATVILWCGFAVLLVVQTQRTLAEHTHFPRKGLKWMGGGFAAWWKSASQQRKVEKEAIEESSKSRTRMNDEPGKNSFLLRVLKWFGLGSRLQKEETIYPPTEKAFAKVKAAAINVRGERDETQELSEGPPPGGLAEPLDFVVEARRERPKEKTQVKIKRTVENWELPKPNLLEDPPPTRNTIDNKVLKRNVEVMEDKLAQFSVRGKVVAVKPGPAVTMYEFKPNADVKISKITELADDLSLALSSESLRIIAPLPGRDVVGIETSNPGRDTVFMKESLDDPMFWDDKVKLPVTLGKQANGESRIEDLRKMPHLLVAGSTGSGKSVFVTSLLTGLLFRHSPKTLRLIIVDPKQVDLAAFHKIPHLLMPPVKDPRKAVQALRYGIREMEKRYRSMSKFEARGLEGFNELVGKFNKEQVEDHALINQELEQTNKTQCYYFQPLPYIVIIVEEFGDLMAVDKLNVENAVVRLAQMARACGIHLVLAMQSPRKDVVTGLIKTNIPGRVSFKVASKTDSRIILDESGAERLLARGDMLFLAPGVSKPQRHHAAYLSEEEIARVAQHWSNQGEPDFDRLAVKALEGSTSAEMGEGPAGASAADDEFGFDETGDEEGFDEKYDEILAWVGAQKEVSASLLQRRFKLGYPRAARLIELFESQGCVGPANGSKPRQVLISKV